MKLNAMVSAMMPETAIPGWGGMGGMVGATENWMQITSCLFGTPFSSPYQFEVSRTGLMLNWCSISWSRRQQNHHIGSNPHALSLVPCPRDFRKERQQNHGLLLFGCTSSSAFAQRRTVRKSSDKKETQWPWRTERRQKRAQKLPNVPSETLEKQ